HSDDHDRPIAYGRSRRLHIPDVALVHVPAWDLQLDLVRHEEVPALERDHLWEQPEVRVPHRRREDRRNDREIPSRQDVRTVLLRYDGDSDHPIGPVEEPPGHVAPAE